MNKAAENEDMPFDVLAISVIFFFLCMYVLLQLFHIQVLFNLCM